MFVNIHSSYNVLRIVEFWFCVRSFAKALIVLFHFVIRLHIYKPGYKVFFSICLLFS